MSMVPRRRKRVAVGRRQLAAGRVTTEGTESTEGKVKYITSQLTIIGLSLRNYRKLFKIFLTLTTIGLHFS